MFLCSNVFTSDILIKFLLDYSAAFYIYSNDIFNSSGVVIMALLGILIVSGLWPY